ncbi:aspS1 [Symbiodinium sp. CCMP2592]|nr:aspS1 [Symbiodinium sp. CCMP2592]
MTEFTGLDLEMTFKDHYHEVLDVLDGLFNHIFTGLTEKFAREIEAVKTQYPLEDLKWKHPCLRLKEDCGDLPSFSIRLCCARGGGCESLPFACRISSFQTATKQIKQEYPINRLLCRISFQPVSDP